MTAPALVLVARGSAEHQANATIHSFRKHLQMMRPDLNVNAAFLEHCPPTGPQVVSALANRGVSELVLVPLSLTSVETSAPMDRLLGRVSAAHPTMRIAASRPLGPSADLLPLLNRQMRSALRARQITQLDALVLAAPDCGDRRGAALLRRRTRQWAAEHRLPCHLALNDGSGPGTAQTVAALRAQGRRHIAVGSLWLTPDATWEAHAQGALAAGAVAVSEPLGIQNRLVELVFGRYAYAAMSLMEYAESQTSIAL